MVAKDTDTEERVRWKLGTRGGAQAKDGQRPIITWAHGQGDMTFEGQRQQMDGQGNTLIMRDLPTSVSHCISPAVTYTSEAGVYGPGNLGQTSGLCNFAASHGYPRSGPGLWQVGSGGKLTRSSQSMAPPQQAGLLSA